MTISAEVREAVAHYRLFMILRCTNSNLHTSSYIILTVCVRVLIAGQTAGPIATKVGTRSLACSFVLSRLECLGKSKSRSVSRDRDGANVVGMSNRV